MARDADLSTNAVRCGLVAVLAAFLIRNVHKHPMNGWIIIMLCAALTYAYYNLKTMKDELHAANERAELHWSRYRKSKEEIEELKKQVDKLTSEVEKERKLKEEVIANMESEIKKAQANAFAVAAGDSAMVAAAMMQRAGGELYAAPRALATRSKLRITQAGDEGGKDIDDE